MRVMGVDPGTRHLGWGVVEAQGGRLRRVDGGTLASADRDVGRRLHALHAGLSRALALHRPQAAALETAFVGDNRRTALAIGEARGMVMVALAAAGLEAAGYPPAAVKRAVAGNGQAGKDHMREIIRVLLALERPPETDHEADALALAVTHALRCRGPGLPGAARPALPRGRRARP